jgi:hypothetical protein
MLHQSVAEILAERVSFELESIDRMYLNGYVPSLQTGGGFVHFLREQLGVRIPSTVMIAPMTRRFAGEIERFAKAQGVDLITFARGQRKDDVAKVYLRDFAAAEGVLFIGKAQEKASVFRTEKRVDGSGARYPWIVRGSAMVNHYYFYVVDRDFGPLFIKFCSYFPYAVKLCINGHEWLKRQLAQRRIEHVPLDNGILSCADPEAVQALARRLDAGKIEALFRKWLRRLPHPFSRQHRANGYRYALSVLQAEFSLTQVLDRPLTGRAFFEEVIRENLDLGRRITRRTPSEYRTRVLTDGVVPSLHVRYKHSKIKQYHKEGRALRTETTINDTYDFGVGRSLGNLPALCRIGFDANRRLLRAQRLSHDCLLGEERFRAVADPVVVNDQRISGLRFDDRRVQALLQALCQFGLTEGLRHQQLRQRVVALLQPRGAAYGAAQMTYDLRRLRLHGLIARVPGSHRYTITDLGATAAQLYVRLYTRALRPAFSLIDGRARTSASTPLTRLQRAMDDLLLHTRLAA